MNNIFDMTIRDALREICFPGRNVFINEIDRIPVELIFWKPHVKKDAYPGSHDVGVHCRVLNGLLSEGIFTIGELKKWSDVDLMKTPNIGKTSLRAIRETLARLENNNE